MLAAAGIRISMDGRGRWMDNVFIERLWRSLKYEDISTSKGYADGREARAGIPANGWLIITGVRTRALANRTPMTVWRDPGAGGRASAKRLWICRCAWTTLPRCPHTHSRSNSKFL